jgi:protein-S-isoprenylcysteine O-methyltransferase Ste14
MISLRFTDYLKRKLEAQYRFYRLFYNIIAVITLIPVLLYSRNLSGYVVFYWSDSFYVIKMILMTVVVLLFIFGALKYDMFELLGIRQIVSGKSGLAIAKDGNISTSGILSLTRHPWYLAALIFIWICDQTISTSTLIINIILTGYIVLGTMIEEKKLIAKYGDEYRQYQKEVSMLFPLKWIVSRCFK